MRGDILADGHFNGRKKGTLTERHVEPKTLQLVLDRIFHLGEAQLDTRSQQGSRPAPASMSAEVTSTLVTGSAATTSQCTGVGEAPPRQARARWNNSALAKNSGRIPAKQHQARDQPRVWITCDVVVALDAIDATEDGVVRTPAVPEEFDAPQSRSPGRCPESHRTRRRRRSRRWTARTPSAGCGRCAAGR